MITAEKAKNYFPGAGRIAQAHSSKCEHWSISIRGELRKMTDGTTDYTDSTDGNRNHPFPGPAIRGIRGSSCFGTQFPC